MTGMKIIKYIQLFRYLLEVEASTPVLACKTIRKIRALPRDLKLAVWDVLEGRLPDVAYQDITLDELVNTEQMKPIRAILMLDWIRREPDAAMYYMQTERYAAPLTITEADKEMLRQALEKWNAEEAREECEEDKEDILIEEK